MSKVFDQFFADLRNERDHATLTALVKRNVTVTDPIEEEYASILTPYACTKVLFLKYVFFSYYDHCRFVSKQLKLKSSVRIIFE